MTPSSIDLTTLPFDIATLQAAYRSGQVTPTQVAAEALRRIGDDPHHAWIRVLDSEALQTRATALEAGDTTLPLYGIPFAIKDNIDLAGTPTTAGCPGYAYTPDEHAFVVQRLIDAGAMPLGKTNLDQFATGLNGTRSPYGACRNAFDAAFVSGGSSAGSAVSVSLGQVSFSLGTDTAGSGRVPAAFNHLVGLKPSLGLLSSSGVVPACRTLDTVSLFTLTADDAQRVFAVAHGVDANDAYSRAAEPHGRDFSVGALRLGVPRADQLRFDDPAYAAAFGAALAHARQHGAEVIELDFEPFYETARLLYEGPWVAERYQAIRNFIDTHPDSVFPVTREITLGGARPLAADAFAAQYRLRTLARRCDAVWAQVDAVLTPTTVGHPRIAAMQADPIALNSALGVYTNFMNLLDYAAVAVPAGFTSAGLPFGITLFAPAHQDQPLLRLAARWQRTLDGRAALLGQRAWPQPAPAPVPAAVPSGWLRVAVCGAHLDGQPLNPQLTSRGAHLVARTVTAPVYRLYALAGGAVARPGLARVAEGGAAIEVEVWELPAHTFGSFVDGIPAPLGIGRTLLADGTQVAGFICEGAGLEGATDITDFAGWRAYRDSLAVG